MSGQLWQQIGVALGETADSIAVGGGVAVLLHWKRPMHRFVERIGDTDIRSVKPAGLVLRSRKRFYPREEPCLASA